MARQKVEQVRCDRCKRVELQPVSEQEKKTPDFSATFSDPKNTKQPEKKIVYHDICVGCRKTLESLWKDLAEWARDIKQPFGVGGEPKAAPLTPAPDYTPPKPHSATGGAKR